MEVYASVIIGVLVALLFLVLIWLLCVRRSGAPNKNYVKLRTAEEYQSEYNLKSFVCLGPFRPIHFDFNRLLLFVHVFKYRGGVADALTSCSLPN